MDRHVGFQPPTKDSGRNHSPEGFEPRTQDSMSNPLTICTILGPWHIMIHVIVREISPVVYLNFINRGWHSCSFAREVIKGCSVLCSVNLFVITFFNDLDNLVVVGLF